MRKRHSLLIVDDEPGILESVKYLLEGDYDIYTATSAAEALKVMEEYEIHIVMTDQRMPFMTGVALLAKIKGKHPDAVRILFTGFADLRAVIEAINQGNVFRYLEKPWNPDELKEAVDAAAEEYERIVRTKELLEATKESALGFGIQASMSPTFIAALCDVLSRCCLSCQPGGDQRIVAQECARTIATESERFATLLTSMLRLLILDELPIAVPAEDFPTSEVVQPLLKDLAPILSDRHIVLHTRGDLSVTIHCNRNLARHILVAVLSNAIRFSPNDTIIELRVDRWGETVRIQVSDQGEGISEEDLPHIFEPFFTSVSETRPLSLTWGLGGRGIGLGLAIAKKFTEMNGGSISLESKRNEGTKVTVCLPLAKEPMDAEHAETGTERIR